MTLSFLKQHSGLPKEGASSEDVLAHAMYVNGWLSHLEMLYLEIRDGALPEEFENTLRWRLASLFAVTLRSHEVWEMWHGYFTGGFQEYVDNLLQQDIAAIYSNTKHY